MNFDLLIDILTIIGFAVTAINCSILLSLFYQKRFCSRWKTKKLMKKLLEYINSVQPDIIFIPTLANNNNIFESQYKKHFETIQTEQISLIRREKASMQKNTCCFSNKFAISIPIEKISQNNKILIIDDVLLTGNTMETISDYIVKNRIVQKQNLFVAGLVCDEVTMKSRNILDHVVMLVNTNKYKFYWRDRSNVK